MDDEKDTYRLWHVRKTIIQVGVIMRVVSSDAWNDYNTYNKVTFLLSAYFLATESDRHMRLLT